MFSLFGKEKDEVVAIFDIGNGSIGGALVKFSKKEAPIIIYTHREPITFMPHVTSKRLLENMLKLLKSVSGNIHTNGVGLVKKITGHHHINRAFCVFSSPWYVSQTRVVKVDKETSFIISENLINSLIQKEQQQFQVSLLEGKYEKIFGDDIYVFENKIIHTKLNGYEVQNPIGKKAREIEISFFSSFISKKIVRQVEDALAHVFHFKSILFSSYALASWSVVCDLYPTVSDFIFIDITGEVTDVSLTIGGVLLETGSFPKGRASLIRKIVEDLQVPGEVAVSFLEMQRKGKLDQKFTAKFKKIVNEAVQSWHESLVESFLNLEKYHILPKKVYYTVDADVEDYFTEALTQQLPPELAISKNMLDINVLNAEGMRNYIHHQDQINRDSFLIIDSIFIGKLTKNIL